jgi:hypothetical protein
MPTVLPPLPQPIFPMVQPTLQPNDSWAAYFQAVDAILRGGGRLPLTGNTTFYVSSSGSDTNGLGTPSSPWATWQHAYNVVANTYDFRGNTITLTSVAANVYTAGISIFFPWLGGGSLVIDGNGSTVNSGAYGFVTNGASLPGALIVQNFNMNCSNSSIYHAVSGTYLVGPGMTYGAGGSPGHIVLAGSGGTLVLANNYSVTGGAPFHWNVSSGGGELLAQGITVTLTGTPAFTTAFANVIFPSAIVVNGNTFVGAATGTRYNAQYGGSIFTGGAGPTYLPGNAAGNVTPGGQYN